MYRMPCRPLESVEFATSWFYCRRGDIGGPKKGVHVVALQEEQ